MKQLALALILLLSLTSALYAQESTVVAVINGEAITAARLDALWSSMSSEMAERYEKVGGKATLLDNYLRKRLLLQEAAKNGFEGMAAGKELSLEEESAVFNRYVRDHFGPQVVTDEMVAEFYAKNPERFRHIDQTLVRQIFISSEKRSLESARELLGQVMQELHHKHKTMADKNAFVNEFANAAAKHSEDERSAADGGSLGWRERVRLEGVLADAAFAIPPGSMSGILQTEKGVHLLFVEDRRPAGIETLERAAPSIRSSLVSRRAQDVVQAANRRTDELMASGEIEIFPENIQ